MDERKTNWWQIVLVLLIGAGAIDGFLWYLYNTYVPLYLQGGNPNILSDVPGFGLTPKVVGLILVLDNIAAFILAPIVGAWSDGYRGRWGRRMPFVVACVPLAALAMGGVPFVARAIPTQRSGDLAALLPLFIPFVALLFLVIVPLAVARTPIDALLYDLAPSKDRTRARSLGVILATLLSIGLGILGGILYAVNPVLPYLLCLVVTLALVGVGLKLIRERRGFEVTDPVENGAGAGGLRRTWSILRGFPLENRRSVLLLSANIFLGAFCFSLIQAFLSSYNVAVLEEPVATAGLPFLIAGAMVMVAAYPAALLANRFGRKRVMLVGLAGWALLALLVYLLPQRGLFIPLLAATGLFYGLWYVNSFVALIDAAPDDRTTGTMTSLTTIANMAGMSVGPFLGGILIEAASYNYAMIFVLQPVVLVLAMLALAPVTRGEMRAAEAPEAQTVSGEA